MSGMYLKCSNLSGCCWLSRKVMNCWLLLYKDNNKYTFLQSQYVRREQNKKRLLRLHNPFNTLLVVKKVMRRQNNDNARSNI